MRKAYQIILLSVFLTALSLVLFVAIISFLPNFFIADSKYQKILAESQTKEVMIKQSKEGEMKKIVSDTNAKLLLLHATSTPSAPKLFREILESRPSGVFITSFSYDFIAKKGSAAFPGITVSGTAENRSELLSFVESLNKNKSFSSVDLPISNLISDTNVSYTLNITVAPLNTK